MQTTITCRCGHQWTAVAGPASSTVSCPQCGSEVVVAGKGPSRRWIVGGCLLMLAVVGILVVAVPTVGISMWIAEGGRMLDEELAQVAPNEPLTAADLETSYRLPADRPDVTQQWIDASRDFAGPTFQQEAAGLPIVSADDENPIPPPSEDWEKLEQARALLADFQESLDQLHAAAATDGAARYPTQFSDGIVMLMTEVQDLRAATRALMLEAHVRAHDGDAAGALRALQTNLRLSRSLEGYPILIAQLVRIALAGMTYNTLAELLPHLEVSDEQLAELAGELERDDFDTGLTDSLIGERVIGVGVFENPGQINETLTPAQAQRIRSLGWLDRDKAYYLRQMRELIAASRAPWPDKLEQVAAIDAAYKNDMSQGNPLQRMQHIISGLLLPALDATFKATARSNAVRNASVAAIAVERYRRAKGELPPTLHALVPEYLDAVPTDPYDGNPLRFIATPNGYTIYSIGRDLQDDRGQVDSTGNISPTDEGVTVELSSATP